MTRGFDEPFKVKNGNNVKIFNGTNFKVKFRRKVKTIKTLIKGNRTSEKDWWTWNYEENSLKTTRIANDLIKTTTLNCLKLD